MISAWDNYCDWLLEEVGFVGKFVCGNDGHFGRHLYPHDYELLMRKLHNINFVWYIERDENRMKDGLALRDEYFDNAGIDGGSFNRKCSVLEMLIGLAIRLDTDYIGDPGEPHPEFIFWDMLCNLGLDIFVNDNFNEIYVEDIVIKWLERKFKSNGKGGIFPLKNDTFDSRNEEIWKLAMAYITENY